MSDPAVVVLFDFDGTLYDGDLPVLAYARHAAAHLATDQGASIIDGIRFFLEGRTVGLSDVDLCGAEDGPQAVELLALAGGVSPDQLDAAYRASRADLANAAFAMDAPPGLVDLLAVLGSSAHVVVVTNAPAAGVREVLSATGLLPWVDEIVTDAGKPAGMTALLHRLAGLVGPGGDRLLAAGARWSADLAPAHRIGCATAYVDRFGRGDGAPTWRAGSLGAMVPQISAWAAARNGRAA